MVVIPLVLQQNPKRKTMARNDDISKVMVEQLAEHGITSENAYIEEVENGVVFGSLEFFKEAAKMSEKSPL